MGVTMQYNVKHNNHSKIVASSNHSSSRSYFNARFTNYISSLIRFSSIDYFRKSRVIKQRQLLVLDAPLGEDGRPYVDQISDSGSFNYLRADCAAPSVESFHMSMSHQELAHAFSLLTDKQKWIITLSYLSQELDREIAERLKITPQAVQKSRVSALRKMRSVISKSSLRLCREDSK